MKVTQRIEFVSNAGAKPAVFETTATIHGAPAEKGKENFAANLAIELEKGTAMSKHYTALPQTPSGLTDFASRSVRPERFIQDTYDLHNTQAVWMEITNTLVKAYRGQKLKLPFAGDLAEDLAGR
jgi:hypothetical protein